MNNTIDNIIDSDEKYKLANEFKNFVSNLKVYVEMEKFTDKIIEIIDNSDTFNFRSERARKFIDKESPTFILNCNLIINDISKMSPVNINKLTDKIEKVLRKEIINKASDFLFECIKDKDSFNEKFNHLKKGKNMPLLSSIYIMRISVKDNCIYLSMFK